VMEVSPHFLQGLDVYVLCVCVYAHTHAACGVLGCEPGCRDENLESLEEILSCVAKR